jgi:endonuclease/exonuclease/phosphatase family metal-dependent hydrolase
MRILSWNVLRRVGATPHDVAQLITQHSPDIVLLQEAEQHFMALPNIVGGRYEACPFLNRKDGLGAWFRSPVDAVECVKLPHEAERRRMPQRVAMIIRIADRTIANLHLSHGQFLLRRQFAFVAGQIDGPAVILGDLNVVGPLQPLGWCDVGPRVVTHWAKGVVPFRLDRCFTKAWPIVKARALHRGVSDHRPIIVDLI